MSELLKILSLKNWENTLLKIVEDVSASFLKLFFAAKQLFFYLHLEGTALNIQGT